MKITKNTPLEKIIKELIKVSLIENQLNKPKVMQIIKVLGGLSKGTAIAALTMYMKGIKRSLEKSRLIIETPEVLTKAEIDQIEEIVQEKQAVFDTEVIVNPKLLGGLKIRIGDTIIDDSLTTKIDYLKEEIIN